MVSDSTVKQVAIVSTAAVNLNGSAIKVKTYNIGGSNYFKIRDLADVMNFAIGWNASSNTINIDTSRGYKI